MMLYMNENPELDLPTVVREADAVLILAGAGLSAEMGIPVYWTGDDATYGNEKSVNGYTALEHSNAMLWGYDTEAQLEYFKNLYAHMESLNFTHSVYADLLALIKDKQYFVATSNVDSAFLRSGFDEDKLFEVHGTYRRSQCLIDPNHGLFDTPVGKTPTCPACGMPARPNVLFFNDIWVYAKAIRKQEAEYNKFVKRVPPHAKNPLILEFGVGTTVPRIRQMGNGLWGNNFRAPYVHVNKEPRPQFLYGDVKSKNHAPELWVQSGAWDAIKSWT
jgi:NAD-dependent SIR2 family protein deacetylase